MPKTHDTLQYIFACLSTNSRLVVNIINDFSNIHEYFCLSPQDKIHLKSFFNTQGPRLLATAYMSEGKRWREVLQTLKYIPKLVSNDELKSYWQNYLCLFEINKSIPDNSLKESIDFLQWLLCQRESTDVRKEVIQYELTKNRVFLYEFKENEYIKNTDKNIAPFDCMSYQCILNPSHIINEFKCQISKVIESLKANTLSEKINPVFDNKIENIIFIKSYNASNVKSIALNPIGNILLNRLNQAQNLLEWKNIVMEELGISQNICIQFIKKMIQSDVVSIIKN